MILTLAAILLAQPMTSALPTSPPSLVTLEDICISGAAGFTDETHAPVLCPTEPVTPPPGWDRGNSFAKDVCTEQDGLESDEACYAAYLAQQRINAEEDAAANRRLLCHGPTEHIPDDDPALALYHSGTLEEREFDLVSDRTEACALSETTELENRP